MTFPFFFAFSLSRWFGDATAELWRYYMGLTANQWLLVAACCVFFGFMCLRGNMIK
jgi:hypothetical protein